MPEGKNLHRLTKPEKLRNARLYNNDKNPIYLPRQYTEFFEKSLILGRFDSFSKVAYHL